MAPNLRSSSRATSNNSRPSTPTATLPAADYIFGDSSRPRKQRRTGRNSRVGVETLDDSREATTEPQAFAITDVFSDAQRLFFGHEPDRQRRVLRAQDSGKITIDQLIANSDWTEPVMREAQPSYKDYTWSSAFLGHNPALASMRALGQLPSATDKRKAGLKVPPPKPIVKEVKENKKATKKSATQQDSSTSANGLTASLSDPANLPIFTSSEYDVEKIRSVVQAALRVADDNGNRAVSQGLRRLWDQSADDSFVLSILDSVMRKNPDPEQKTVFKTFMRHAYKQTLSTLPTVESTEPEPISRSLSTASIDSLTSEKSADVRPGKPAPTGTGTGAITRGRKRARDPEIAPTSASNLEDVTGQKRYIEDLYDDEEEEEDAASVAKRTRRDNFPIVAKQSRIRSSLGRDSPVSSTAHRTRNRTAKTGNERLSSAAYEGPDNNDFCRQCQRKGSLLCCDGCVIPTTFRVFNLPWTLLILQKDNGFAHRVN